MWVYSAPPALNAKRISFLAVGPGFSYFARLALSNLWIAQYSKYTMTFSRNQLIGGLLLLIVIWMVILYRVLFSAA